MKNKIRKFMGWLFSGKMLKRYLVGGVILTTLVALFYAEENWRWAREWSKTKAELEAKGETFDVQKLIPPPVPDAENFCRTPLLAEYLENERKLSAPDLDNKTREELGDKQRKIKRFSSKNPISERVVAKTNDKEENTRKRLKFWWNASKRDLEAWGDYYFYDPDFAKAHSDARGAEAVRLYFAQHEKEWMELERASLRKYARFDVDYDRQPSYQITLGHISLCMDLAQGIGLKSTAEFASGDNVQALATLRILFKMREGVSKEPILISQLINASLLSQGMQSIWEALESRRLSEQDLDTISAWLSSIDLLKGSQLGMRGERSVFHVQSMDYLKFADFRARTQFFRVMGDLSEQPQGTVGFMSNIGGLIIAVIPKGWFDLNKVYGAQMMQNYVLSAVSPEEHRIYPDRIKKGEEAINQGKVFSLRFPQRAFFAYLNMSGLQNSLWEFAKTQSNVDMALIACELEKYYLKNRAYPKSLDQLGKTLPHDVVNGEPYHYQITKDGRYKLWAVGRNGIDEGGKRVYRKNRPDSVNWNEGDQVWSYSLDVP